MAFKKILATVLVSACAAAGAQSTSSATKAVPVAAAAEYRLGAGDIIRVTVYQNPDLSLDARVSEAGVISFPLLGNLKVGGLPVSQVEKRIADGLREGNFVKQPQVSILIQQVRGNQASVLGQVNKPGRFPLEAADLRLSDLLAIAGGVATAGADVVTLISTRGGQSQRIEVDLPKAFGPDRHVEDPVIQNGDIVWVDRAPIVYIYGEVQRAGALRLERGMTVMQALATGGGLTQRGTEKGIRVHRKGSDSKVQVVQPGMDDVLQDGDVVYVRESLF